MEKVRCVTYGSKRVVHSNLCHFFLANLVALSQHPEWSAWDQPLRGEPELPAGPGGPHPGGQQQQLQRDLCLHAHPQSGHDHRQQAGRVTHPLGHHEPTLQCYHIVIYVFIFLSFIFFFDLMTCFDNENKYWLYCRLWSSSLPPGGSRGSEVDFFVD